MRAARSALALAAVWWSLVLLAGVTRRAFDVSDPGQQLAAAARSAEVLALAGPRAWLGAVLGGSLGKPAQNAVLSQALAAGLPPTKTTYFLVTGLAALGALLLMQVCVLLLLGVHASIAFALLCAASSSVVSEFFHGGHTWYGQLFLWAALALELRVGDSASRKSFLVGALCGLAALGSHHMAPAAAALCLWRAWTTRGRALPGLALGAFGPLLLVEALATGENRPHYWQVLGRMLALATQAKDASLPEVHGFVFRWLFGESGPLAGALILSLALYGVARSRPLLIALGAALLVYELPWALKIGRVQLPLLFLLLACAAAGAAALPKRASVVALALLVSAALPRLLSTRAAFHAFVPAYAAGVSVPFDYGERGRLRGCAQLASLPAAEPVLVSPWSGWYWRGFLPRERFDVPVEALFASPAAYAEAPGVEDSPYFLFSNDAFFQRVLTGELAFPAPNRVYAAGDVADACRKAGIL